jgi:hypothetical protein
MRNESRLIRRRQIQWAILSAVALSMGMRLSRADDGLRPQGAKPVAEVAAPVGLSRLPTMSGESGQPNNDQHSLTDPGGQNPFQDTEEFASSPGYFEWSRVAREWLDQPLYVSFMAGGMRGNGPVSERVEQTEIGLFTGLSFGWDFSQYLGTEKRFGYAAPQIESSNLAGVERNASMLFGEYRLLVYPLGESKWRPYFVGGIGLAELNFRDDHAKLHHNAELLFPLGVGIKVMHGPHFASRLELLDDFSLGSGDIAAMHNISLSLGFELRFHLADFATYHF